MTPRPTLLQRTNALEALALSVELGETDDEACAIELKRIGASDVDLENVMLLRGQARKDALTIISGRWLKP